MKEPFRTFLSYSAPYERFVRRVSYHLRRQPEFDPVCIAPMPQWREQVGDALDECDVFVIFVGESLGATQKGEAEHFLQSRGENTEVIRRCCVAVKLPGATQLDGKLFQLGSKSVQVEGAFLQSPEHIGEVDNDQAEMCAKEIVDVLFPPKKPHESRWIPPDGLPIGYPFAFEKDIITEYAGGKGRLRSASELQEADSSATSCEIRLEQGCPERWPKVSMMPEGENGGYRNPLPEQEIGRLLDDKEKIVVDVRTSYHSPGEWDGDCRLGQFLTFPEAGPQTRLIYPREGRELKVGILVSGGICPGINAVIAGIVARHELYMERQTETEGTHEYSLQFHGYRDGFSGLLRDSRVALPRDFAEKHANQGGSILGTSRCDALLNLEEPKARDSALRGIIGKLLGDMVDILYVIGGDGSLRAAHAIWTRARDMRLRGEVGRDLSVVGVPKAIDNDVLWVWQSFGFLTAVEKANEIVLHLHKEAGSNPRLCIVQLFGSDSGFAVSHVALASGVCCSAIIPEIDFTLDGLFTHVKKCLQKPEPDVSPYGIVLLGETVIPHSMAPEKKNPETGIPEDLHTILEDPDVALEPREKTAIISFIRSGRRIHGQPPDELRSGSLKMIARVLQKRVKNMKPHRYWQQFRVFCNEPRHLLRAINPTVGDITLGRRLGTLAVDNAMAGYTDFMISEWLTEYVLVPLPLVVLGRKRVPRDGIFWKSVLASTGQPANMVSSTVSD